MKCIRTAGLLAVIMASVMAFASTASASTFTSPTGTTYTGKIVATAGATSFHGAFTTVTCNKSNVEGTVTSHGAGVTVKGSISTLDFTECNFPTNVEAGGTLELHAIRPAVSPHTTCLAEDGDKCDGTLTSSGTKMTMTTSVGSCTFTTASTSIGTITGSSTTGGKAKIDVHGTIPRTAGNFLCGTTCTWTGSYTIDTPSTLWIDE